MSEPVVARQLVKRYGPLTAVDHVDLTVERGDVFGFLGPNGAGKTTSLRMLLGLIRPTSGSVRLFGRDPIVDGARARDAVEGPRFYPYLSARRNLLLLADYDGDGARSRVDGVLELVDLRDRAGDRVGGYSHGMTQRLGIAASLLREPKLLLLDEPTTGLDPAGMRDMRALVRRLAHEGLTILLSSHLLNEVEELCNRVAIIRAGRIVYEGSLAALQDASSGGYRLRATRPEQALVLAAEHVDARLVDGDIAFTADEQTLAALTVELGRAGIGVLALVPERASLEDLFLDLTEAPRAAAAAPEPAEALA